MRLRVGKLLIKFMRWLIRHHRPVQSQFLDRPTCAVDYEYWPCKVWRETEERAARLPNDNPV